VLVLEASLRSFPASVYTQVRLVELAHLDDLATILLPSALLATATLVLVTIARPGRTRWLALTALVLLLVTFAISALISVPINTDQQTWSVLAPPNNWVGVRNRRQVAHLVRTSAPYLPSWFVRQRRSRGDHRLGGRREHCQCHQAGSDRIRGGRR
jgi:Anthrone oxygenase